MNYRKKVSGERLGAAILDSIFVSIVSLIPMGIYMAIILDFDDIFNSLLVNLTFGEEGYTMFLVYSIVVELIIGILYFGLLPYKKNGQTWGKKILRIKAVDEYGENPTFIKHLIRAIQNWTVYISVPFLLLMLIVNEEIFIIVFGLFGNVMNLVVFVSLILVFAREDGRGIHDLLANTMVVSADEDFNKEFAMKTAQMGEWAEVADLDDSGFQTEDKEEDKDEWKF